MFALDCVRLTSHLPPSSGSPLHPIPHPHPPALQTQVDAAIAAADSAEMIRASDAYFLAALTAFIAGAMAVSALRFCCVKAAVDRGRGSAVSVNANATANATAEERGAGSSAGASRHGARLGGTDSGADSGGCLALSAIDAEQRPAAGILLMFGVEQMPAPLLFARVLCAIGLVGTAFYAATCAGAAVFAADYCGDARQWTLAFVGADEPSFDATLSQRAAAFFLECPTGTVHPSAPAAVAAQIAIAAIAPDIDALLLCVCV